MRSWRNFVRIPGRSASVSERMRTGWSPLSGPRLAEAGHAVVDLGTHSAEATDYPIFARRLAEALIKGRVERGIFIGGSGEGEMIAANKYPGIRAVLCEQGFTAHLTMEHNDANVLCLSADLLGEVVQQRAGAGLELDDRAEAVFCQRPRGMFAR